MSIIQILSIIFGSIAGYGIMIGITFQMAGGDVENGDNVFVGILWPVMLPAMTGIRVVKWICRNKIPTAKVIK